MTALPCPTSAASSSNWPGAGRGACHSNSGSSKGTPARRHCHGQRSASSTPPASAAAPSAHGAAAIDTLAQGQLASHCSTHASGHSAQAAACHSGAQSTPSSDSGVTTNVTHGIASRLLSNPTTEACPNKISDSGVSASVTTHCSRNNRTNRPPALV